MRRKHLHRFIIVGLLVIQSTLLVWSAKVHSPTWDEVGHLAAGISHLKLNRFDLYSVNPPLVRTLAAAPVVLFYEPSMDWDYYRSDPAIRSEVYLGRRMINLDGKQSLDYFFVSRLALIPIALLGGLLCYLWGRDLFGENAGLVAMTLWTFSPNVLAYGSVITPDLASAVALIGSSYVLWRWINEPSWGWTLTLASAMALAMLTKSVWLILPPVFAVVWLLAVLWSPKRAAKQPGHRHESQTETHPDQRLSRPSPATFIRRLAASQHGIECRRFAVATITAVVLVNAFYGFSGSFVPLRNYKFVSSRLSGTPLPDPACVDCDSPDPDTLPENAFAGSPLGWLPVPLPQNYLQGIDVQIRDFERGRYDINWESYLMGQWKHGGWWYYYLLGLFWKIPLAIWLMLALAIASFVIMPPSYQSSLGLLCLILPALAFFVLVSAGTGLNRYVRYAIPVLPVLLILAARFVELIESLQSQLLRKLVASMTIVLCGALILVSLRNAPHHLSFFNSAAGNSSNAFELLCDSNIDWGQDLTLLQSWLEQHPDAADSLYLAYFGSFSPASIGISFQTPPPALNEDIAEHPLYQHVRLRPGWYVISKSYLAGHPMPVPDHLNRLQFPFLGRHAFSYFTSLQPDAQIGTSMLAYHLDETKAAALTDQLNKHANELRTALKRKSKTKRQLGPPVPKPVPLAVDQQFANQQNRSGDRELPR